MHPAIPVYTRRRLTSEAGKEYWGFEKVNLGAGRKPAGPFWLRHTENGKQKWVSAGDDYTAAIELRDKMKAVNLADRQGLTVGEADRKEAADIGSLTLATQWLPSEEGARGRTRCKLTAPHLEPECLGSRVRFTNELTEQRASVRGLYEEGRLSETIRTRAMYVKIFWKRWPRCACQRQNMPKAQKESCGL